MTVKRRGIVDYETQNLCRKCRLPLPKDFIRCPECNRLVHTRKLAKLRGRPYERKYIE